MEILGIGPLEFLLIILIALIVFGPKDLVKSGRTLGRFLNKVINSPEWRSLLQVSREVRNLPTRLMREANLEREELEMQNPGDASGTEYPHNSLAQDIPSNNLLPWTTPPGTPTPSSSKPPQDFPPDGQS